MKKNYVIAAVISLLVLTGVAAALIMHSNTTNIKQSSTAAYKPVNACKVFTLAEAKTVLGTSTTAGDNSDDAKSNDIQVSTCTYNNNAVTDHKSATVMVRAALTKTGADSNKAGFDAAMPQTNMQMIDGYGDSAYFIAEYGQLSILDRNNWIMVNAGGSDPSQQTLADAKLVADKVLN